MKDGALRRLLAVSITQIGFGLLLAGCSGGGGGGDAPAPTATASASATLQPTSTPTSTATLTHSALPSSTPSSTHTSTPPQEPTRTNTSAPTIEPTPTPTEAPSDTPTEIPPPTHTATATPLTGPIVTALGVADASGTFNASIDTDEEGRAIFNRNAAAGFTLYVEGRPGLSGLPVATQLLNTRPDDPSRQPDLQIVSSRDLGNGSPAVCDRSFPNGGGVPAASAQDLFASQSTSDALNDLACRFKSYLESDFACTQDSAGNLLFASVASTTQFCMLVDQNIAFANGDTVLTVRLRDTAGNVGVARQIVVRIVGATN